jgi:hypothetical protein
MTKTAATAVMTLALTACSKRAEEAPAPPAPLPAAPSAPTPAATDTIATDSADIPTEEDFEADAERRITSKNLEAELDKLEQEIGQP